MGSVLWDKRVDGEGNPDGGSEQDNKPPEQMPFSEDAIESVVASPHCAERVDDEVDR